MEKSAKCGPIWDGSSTGKGSKSNDLGFQNGSQSDDLGVPGRSGRGPRAPKSTPKGGPGGVRGGSWRIFPRSPVRSPCSKQKLAHLGPLLGRVLGPMLEHFGAIFVSFSCDVLDITAGPLLGAILHQLGPQIDPRILPERLSKRAPTRNSENTKNAQPSYVFARF